VADERGAATLASRLLREVLFEADRDLGDGTARLALLWGGLLQHGARAVSSGVPPLALADALTDLGSRLSNALETTCQHGLPDADELTAVASSAGAPRALAREIGQMLHGVGSDGAIEVVKGRERGLKAETGEGFIFEASPVSEAFALADFDPAYLLVADEVIDDFGPLAPLLESFATRGKALVVVARDVTGVALQALVRNHKQNGLRAAAFRPTAVSRQAADAVEDLAVATGATLVADRFGTSLAYLRPSMLGRAGRFSFARGLAILRDPAGDREASAMRRRQLLAEAERHKHLALDRERLEQRAARLHGRWGRLHVAESSDKETLEVLYKTRRALASARSAAIGGTLVGGAVGLVRSFDRMAANEANASGTVIASAHQCLAASVADLYRRLSGAAPFDAPLPSLRRVPPAGLAAVLGLGPSRDASAGQLCLDPLPLTRSIVERAVSGAAATIRLGAIVGS
jgi:chaperonin GroEL (HSP60 family)